MIFWIVKVITFLPLTIFCPTRMLGKRNIPKGKVIVVCNHKSNMDYCYLFTKIWRKQFVLAKKELFKNRPLGWFFKKCCGIPVDRNSVEISTIKSCLNVLKQNKMLTIFPEGTRNKTDNKLLDFKAGTSVFAVKSSAPVVPMVILKKPRLFHVNLILVGKPLYFDSSFKGEEGQARANEIIKQSMLDLMAKYNLK